MKVRELKKILEQHGYSFHRTGKGDHEIWINQDGHKITLGDSAGGKEVGIGIANKILKIIGAKRK